MCLRLSMFACGLWCVPACICSHVCVCVRVRAFVHFILCYCFDVFLLFFMFVLSAMLLYLEFRVYCCSKHNTVPAGGEYELSCVARSPPSAAVLSPFVSCISPLCPLPAQKAGAVRRPCKHPLAAVPRPQHHEGPSQNAHQWCFPK